MTNISDRIFELMVKENYYFWEELFQNNRVSEELLVFLDSIKGLTERQLYQTRRGLSNKLSDEQIKVLAKYFFSDSQIGIIIDSFLEGFTPDQVAVFANPKYNHEQMLKIREGLKLGVSIEKIKTLANPELHAGLLEQKIKAEYLKQLFEENLTKN